MDVVVSLDFPPEVGGAHLWLYEVYRRWPKQVAVFTSRPPTNAEAVERVNAFDALQSGSLRVYRDASGDREINLLKLSYLLKTFSQARRVAKLAQSDGCKPCLHALRAFPEGFIALLAKRLLLRDAMLVTYAHGEEILVAGSSRQLSAMTQWVYRGSNAIIANSDNTVNLVRRVCPTARVVRVHPGVDESFFFGNRCSAREQMRLRLGWSQDTFVLFSIARMEPRKNQSMVIRAVASLRNKGYDIRYICAGNGETRNSLESLVYDLGVQGSVAFPGQISDAEKREFLQGADVHIMISIQHGAMIEGFGIVFMEAAAAGLPSIAGDSGGQPEAVLDGRTGIVVDGRSFDEVAAAILKLAVDKELRNRLSMAAKSWAQEHQWDQVLQRIVAELNSLKIT
jgi:phosphatidylinositol alpha-1,6-mannosyltransferase